MSRLNIFLILLLMGMLAFVQIQNASAVDSAVDSEPLSTPTVIPTPTAIPIGTPLRIHIPAIQVNSSVQAVGTDFQGKMVMPEDWYTTAWYSGESSYKPGEKGNAVIAGHLDTIYGTRGQFYFLSQLKIGDDVLIDDSTGEQRHFVVIDKQTYPYDTVPLEQIFGPSEEKHLNLITCTGIYNRALHNYTQRLVVFTKLVE